VLVLLAGNLACLGMIFIQTFMKSCSGKGGWYKGHDSVNLYLFMKCGKYAKMQVREGGSVTLNYVQTQSCSVRFWVLTAASMKLAIFWDVVLCSLLQID
jgi:hypothetical protein